MILKAHRTFRTLLLVLSIVTAIQGRLIAQEGPKPSVWLHDIRVGVLVHDVDGLWSGLRKEGGVDLSVEILLRILSFPLVYGRVHPNLGATVNTQGDTSKVYLGLLWDLETFFGLFFNLGLGGAVHNGDLDSGASNRKQLGARILFRIPFEVGFALAPNHRISVVFDHISNAYLAKPNQGLDTLGVRYSLRF